MSLLTGQWGAVMDPNHSQNEAQKLYLVDARVLPDAVRKAAEVAELLKGGQAASVGEAVKIIGISRSAYYRYKDYIHPFRDVARQSIVTLSMELEHRSGILSSVLNTVAEMGGNILTINQGIPLHGYALASLSVETGGLTQDFDQLIECLRQLRGVRNLEIMGQS